MRGLQPSVNCGVNGAVVLQFVHGAADEAPYLASLPVAHGE
jgi:hypothetical protein